MAKVIQEIDEYLQIVEEEGEKKIACKKCGYVLCDAAENYKEYALRRVGPITEVPGVPEAEVYGLKRKFEFRQYFCPQCKVLFKSESALEGDPIIEDFKPLAKEILDCREP